MVSDMDYDSRLEDSSSSSFGGIISVTAFKTCVVRHIFIYTVEASRNTVHGCRTVPLYVPLTALFAAPAQPGKHAKPGWTREARLAIPSLALPTLDWSSAG